MSLERTHSIELSVDSTFITIKDTTSLADYTAEGLDPITDITAIELRLTDNETSTETVVDITASAADLRDGNGLKVYAETISIGDTFTDDLWVSEIDYTFVSTYSSVKNELFYSDIKNKIAVSVISSDWKDGFNYISRSSSSKNSLKLKSWLDNLIVANDNELYSEGLSILNSLKTTLYD